ncbi:MAG TPA: hypothetical protein VK897_13065 [Anaerolineales bacterium]|nr:hypothetical protein [Anaerolineales bacterium]
MKAKSSIPSAEDKEEAKRIFFEYSCNHVEMARNDVYFSKYHISKEQEAEWRNEFITDWRNQLSTEDLTAVQKLEEAHAVESIPDLIAMVDKGDSYAKLRIAQALLSLADWQGRDETLRTQTRATALKTVQSILDHPVQLSERHKSDIERLGDFDPENYVITFAKLAKGEYATLKLKGSTESTQGEAKIIPVLHYPLMGMVILLLCGALATLYMVLLDRLFSALSIDADIYRAGIPIVSLLLAMGTILVFRRLST